jgi:hypothetical protein
MVNALGTLTPGSIANTVKVAKTLNFGRPLFLEHLLVVSSGVSGAFEE